MFKSLLYTLLVCGSQWWYRITSKRKTEPETIGRNINMILVHDNNVQTLAYICLISSSA